MYKIVFPIAAFPISERVFWMFHPLARDVLAHAEAEPELRLLCPRADSREGMADGVEVNLDDYPGLSIGLLPWNGDRRTLPLCAARVYRVLAQEAATATVWQDLVSTDWFDLVWLAHKAGQRHARGARLLSVDSDPAAILATSQGPTAKLQSTFIRRRDARWTRQADGVIFIGKGPTDTYGRFARKSITTTSVFLKKQDLADEAEVTPKFSDANEPVRLLVGARLMPWKGVDDVLLALSALHDQIGTVHLDIVGEGPENGRLEKLAATSRHTIRFMPFTAYGEPYFKMLRSYHVVFAPTRALEEGRIIYDAAASGVVLVHSATSTHESALAAHPQRWSFAPGDVADLQKTLLDVFASRPRWGAAALAGIEFMAGRTIDQMHARRASFVQTIVDQVHAART
jgi:glycosyltransferase involved in cell wall biosynthesis